MYRFTCLLNCFFLRFLGVGLPSLMNCVYTVTQLFGTFCVQVFVWQTVVAIMTDVKASLEALEVLRPKCSRFGTKKGCKHSQTCKFLHEGDQKQRDGPRADYPYTSVHNTDDGLKIVSRPPIGDAWQAYFEFHRTVLFIFCIVI